MNLTTQYLGLPLSSPFMPGASPLVDELDNVKRLEDAGASAIVMHSLFEEQVTRDEATTEFERELYTDAFAEARSYFAEPPQFNIGPEQYIKHLSKIKKAVGVPVIGSLNGTTSGGWTEYAQLIEQAGADALELNVYYISTDPNESAGAVDDRAVEVLKAVRSAVRIPVAVKLSPYYSSLASLAARLQEAGANGLVVFNRFYQPDLNIEDLEVLPRVHLSTSQELLLRLRWLAILSTQRAMSLACSGGVQTADDALKAIMCGADAVQLVSSLLRFGIGHLRTIRQEAERWLEEHEYNSVEQLQGSMNLARCPNPSAFERANYMRTLQSWRDTHGSVVGV
jgi:dihydroorotate dehydrogenase (fumarate)